jgi:hypothetical protein
LSLRYLPAFSAGDTVKDFVAVIQDVESHNIHLCSLAKSAMPQKQKNNRLRHSTNSPL